MSKRFAPAPKGDQDSPSTRTVLDDLVEKQHGKNPNFTYKDAHGNPIGLFGILAHTPDLLNPVLDFGASLAHQQNLSPRIRELAIFAVVATYPTPYVEYAHSGIAQTLEQKLESAQIEAACSGATPASLSEREAVAYKTALVLARNMGTLTDEQWSRAERVLGREGVTRVANVVGFYLHMALVMRMGEVGVPAEEAGADGARQ